MVRREETLLKMFPEEIRKLLVPIPRWFEQTQEIRLRAGGPLLLQYGGKEYVVCSDGSGLGMELKCAYQVSAKQIRETLEHMASYSLYAFEEEIRQGFLTLPGGHRIGIAGKTIVQSGEIRSMKFLSFLNIRLAHEVLGCADQVFPQLFERGQLCSVLILSPPRCGKTTLLRDIVRQISDGSLQVNGMTVGLVDERSEIAACYQGVPQNDVGIRTDVLDACPKAHGMMMLIRTMAPQVVAVDEIGSRMDMEAVEYAMNCGCRVIATVHGNGMEDIRKKPVLDRMLREKWFDRYLILHRSMTEKMTAEVCDAQGNPIGVASLSAREVSGTAETVSGKNSRSRQIEK
ncbi:stage III sporulation protein AA [Brotaphodocola sp.]|uniref:stage III sporulation protein AA n=1 Tax=Brotaphodocola sp. TaxID=3073577 RepID=UPI003D7E1DB3